MTSESQVRFCPHCNHKASQRTVFQHEYCETLYAKKDGEVWEVPGTYVVAVCDTCDNLLLYSVLQSTTVDVDNNNTQLLWPTRRDVSEAVPARVRAIYSEATAIREIAPNAFAVQVRRALEALCVDRGIDQGALGKRLEVLVSRGELPEALAEMSDILRLLGNVGAHADELEVHKGHVYALDEFFHAIIEYVYVAPQKVREFRQQLEESKKGPPESQ